MYNKPEIKPAELVCFKKYLWKKIFYTLVFTEYNHSTCCLLILVLLFVESTDFLLPQSFIGSCPLIVFDAYMLFYEFLG